MNALKTLPIILMLPFVLTACSGDDEPADESTTPSAAETSSEPATEPASTPEPVAQTPVNPQPEAETDPRIVEGLDFLTGGPGVAVFGQNIVLNVPTRDETTASLAREVALGASNMSPASAFTVFVVESDAAATGVPAEGDYVCAVTAKENLVQESTC